MNTSRASRARQTCSRRTGRAAGQQQVSTSAASQGARAVLLLLQGVRAAFSCWSLAKCNTLPLVSLRQLVCGRVGQPPPHLDARHWRVGGAGGVLGWRVVVCGGWLVLLASVPAAARFIAHGAWPSADSHCPATEVQSRRVQAGVGLGRPRGVGASLEASCLMEFEGVCGALAHLVGVVGLASLLQRFWAGSPGCEAFLFLGGRVPSLCPSCAQAWRAGCQLQAGAR